MPSFAADCNLANLASDFHYSVDHFSVLSSICICSFSRITFLVCNGDRLFFAALCVCSPRILSLTFLHGMAWQGSRPFKLTLLRLVLPVPFSSHEQHRFAELLLTTTTVPSRRRRTKLRRCESLRADLNSSSQSFVDIDLSLKNLDIFERNEWLDLDLSLKELDSFKRNEWLDHGKNLAAG